MDTYEIRCLSLDEMSVCALAGDKRPPPGARESVPSRLQLGLIRGLVCASNKTQIMAAR